MLIKSVEADTLVFAYNSQSRIYTKNTGSGSVSDYLYANGMILASINASTIDYYHEDALGIVRLVSSSAETTLFSTDYRPYGPAYGAWGGSEAFEYTGKPTDVASGLDYSGARWYDPASGRFMTEDTSTYNVLALPLTLNEYVYADDNPMSLADVSGHFGVANPTVAKRSVSPVSNAFVVFIETNTKAKIEIGSFLADAVVTFLCPELDGLETVDGTENNLASAFTFAIGQVDSDDSLYSDISNLGSALQQGNSALVVSYTLQTALDIVQAAWGFLSTTTQLALAADVGLTGILAVLTGGTETEIQLAIAGLFVAGAGGALLYTLWTQYEEQQN